MNESNFFYFTYICVNYIDAIFSIIVAIIVTIQPYKLWLLITKVDFVAFMKHSWLMSSDIDFMNTKIL